jgi:hypothetical protein
MSNILNIALVVVAGAVDRKASSAAFESAVDKYIEDQKTEQSTIADAVNAVLTAQAGEPIKMPTLGAFACQKLNAPAANFATLEARVLAFVRTNSQEYKDSTGAVVKNPASLFVISKGKGGGVRLRSSMPAAPAATSPEAASSESDTDSTDSE